MVLFENEVPQWCGDVDGGLSVPTVIVWWG